MQGVEGFPVLHGVAISGGGRKVEREIRARKRRGNAERPLNVPSPGHCGRCIRAEHSSVVLINTRVSLPMIST